MSSSVIELSDLPPMDDTEISSGSGTDSQSNFGLDFLMNTNAKSLGTSSVKNVPLDNLDDLENELNALSNPEQNSSNTHDISELFKIKKNFVDIKTVLEENE